MSFYLSSGEYASSVWAVLERFGNKKVFEELNGSGIHRLQNILTLNPIVHHLFDTLRLWLEPVGPVSNFLLHVNWSFKLFFSE